MHPRIEVAEVVSFRLKVPRPELDRLPQSLGPELGVQVSLDEADVVVTMEDADSSLRFKPIGQEAILTEVAIANDERGLFFQKVLGALMVRYFGDLHCRLTWNDAARNGDQELSEVKIVRGATSFPGLSQPMRALPPAMGAGGPEGHTQGPTDPEAPELKVPPTAEEREVLEILARARRQWDEYQKLKAKKG